MSKDNEWINNLGSICEGRDGKSLYIKVRKDVNLKEGDNLRMVKHTDEVQRKVDAGIITEEEAQQQLEKLSFVKYTLHRPPRN